jgi:hypothetical protein
VFSEDLILIYRMELPVRITGIHCTSHISEEYVMILRVLESAVLKESGCWDGFEFNLISCSDLKNQMREFLV